MLGPIQCHDPWRRRTNQGTPESNLDNDEGGGHGHDSSHGVGRRAETKQGLTRHQENVLGVVRQRLNKLKWEGHWSTEESEASVVLLASRKYANWLSDDQFVLPLLDCMRTPKQTLPPGEPAQQLNMRIHVLSGVVDDVLRPRNRLFHPAQGFSVMYGTRSILPNFWEDKSDAARQDSRPSDPEKEAVITLRPSIPGKLSSLSVTMPLANTLFVNGRRSTLVASEYSTGASKQLELVQSQPKDHQKINFLRVARDDMAHVNLMPLAPPRKIMSGLGNIVRQINISGQPLPASHELEMLIPRLLEKRARQPGAAHLQGPVGVWAYILPPDFHKQPLFQTITRFCERHTMGISPKKARKSKYIVANYLLNGFPLHKVCK
jgi:hypothetical protein